MVTGKLAPFPTPTRGTLFEIMKITFIAVQNGGQTFYDSAFVDYGYYATVLELIKSINAAKFNPRTEKTGVTLPPSYYGMLYEKLSKILGYGGRHIKIRKSTESSYVADLFGITSIFVYCDIVQPQIVRDTSVPLLRTVLVSEKSGDLITKTFNNIL